ncbi:hypothetical protein [Aureispira anguillae]|uniref:Uncharacterized protein n=1 Tax=Aureispira anguillae TaxID=2864201 RepID=A0A915YCH4_9BACT|nr:hypothetical protein [Aureispira anguillae]BDS10545.1 hypothetical protein AsAng_0012530 [Aureispira anguillae]
MPDILDNLKKEASPKLRKLKRKIFLRLLFYRFIGLLALILLCGLLFKLSVYCLPHIKMESISRFIWASLLEIFYGMFIVISMNIFLYGESPSVPKKLNFFYGVCLLTPPLCPLSIWGEPWLFDFLAPIARVYNIYPDKIVCISLVSILEITTNLFLIYWLNSNEFITCKKRKSNEMLGL